MVKKNYEQREREARKWQPFVDAQKAHGRKDEGPTFDWTAAPLAPYDASRRQQLLASLRRTLGTEQHRLLAVLEEGAENSPEMRYQMKLARAALLKEEGTALFARADYAGAIEKYKDAMRSFLGKDAVLPAQTYYAKHYLDADWHGPAQRKAWKKDGDYTEVVFVDLLVLAGNIAQSYMKLPNMHIEAIDWLRETEVILSSICVYGWPDPMPAWKSLHYVSDMYWLSRFKTWLRGYGVFDALGNTSARDYYASRAQGDVGYLPEQSAAPFPRLKELRDEASHKRIHVWFRDRHPELSVAASDRKVRYPELQVLGVWQRIKYGEQKTTYDGLTKPCGRQQASVWIWHGSLYVGGGTNGMAAGGNGTPDMWCLNLKTRTWRRLPDIPFPAIGRQTRDLTADYYISGLGNMQVWSDRVYCFSGDARKVAVFDLAREEWTISATTLAPGTRWPYSEHGRELRHNATAMLDGVLYVFGGRDGAVALGQNIFVALDLRTLRWRHISGSSDHRPSFFEPNLRTNPALWAVPARRKLYLLYGAAERSKAFTLRQPHGSEDDDACQDFWSFDVDAQAWTRERIRGNFPSPRTEMAVVHAPALGRAVVFGGYTTALQLFELARGTFFQFAYFGDSYLFDPTTGLWQHVLVQGFPSYRACSSLVCDPDTGAIYMFGGYSNSDYVPANSAMTRTYNDLWKLKLDMPGGNWNPEDLERDIRMEKIGPWMRCFTCGVAGIEWQKCGGTCGGKYYFCSRDCQKAGWKEHKEKHGCRKS